MVVELDERLERFKDLQQSIFFEIPETKEITDSGKIEGAAIAGNLPRVQSWNSICRYEKTQRRRPSWED